MGGGGGGGGTSTIQLRVTCVSWLFTLTCLLPSFLVAPVLNYTFIIYYKATSILAILVVRACLLQQRKKKMEESSFVLTTSLSTLRTILKCLQKQILLSYSYMWYTTVPIPHPCCSFCIASDVKLSGVLGMRPGEEYS